ncbi:hypothetical protein ANDA3_3997 [plant metagenome]|uniref:Uncharacterized protein n=1 Tax=plant metagenome TaxID=1297885 RepID=A0A484T501_9ZZZZ
MKQGGHDGVESGDEEGGCKRPGAAALANSSVAAWRADDPAACRRALRAPGLAR